VCLPLPDSLPREQRVFSNRGAVGDFGFVDGPFAMETPVMRAGGISLLHCKRPNPRLPCPTRRAYLDPRPGEPFLAIIYLVVCIPYVVTLFPEGLSGLSNQSGGRSARMDRFEERVSP
jgi:hypothetical protein